MRLVPTLMIAGSTLALLQTVLYIGIINRLQRVS